MLFHKPHELSHDDRLQLLEIARRSLKHGVDHHAPLPLDPDTTAPALCVPRASFVTLERHAELRGCIGSLEARDPLAVDVSNNAFRAGFMDPRFPPVTADELDALDIHISVLSPPEPMAFDSETELLNQIRPGVDGLIIEDQGRRATFLPSVWKSAPEPGPFLAHLKHKAGLPVDHWSPTLKAWRYTTESIRKE